MAILTSDELSFVRRTCQEEDPAAPIATANKPVFNLAIQAIEDWWVDNAASLSTAINTATSPTVLTTAQKKKIGKAWLLSRFNRGN